MRFSINHDLLAHARASLGKRSRLCWVIGGAGSGKTTLCQALSTTHDIPVYDMDAHIYGAFHERFTQERHPVNKAWSMADNGLAWLLDMSWDDFDRFQRAALPEYLSLLAEDLENTDPNDSVLIDGGVYHPALIAQVISPRQIVSLAAPERSNNLLWDEVGERKAMKDAVSQLPGADQAWQKFLDFDRKITQVILRECRELEIPVFSRKETGSASTITAIIAGILGIHPN